MVTSSVRTGIERRGTILGKTFSLSIESCRNKCANIHRRRLFSSARCESMMRGALIVLEGVDRAGKSTQCQKLVDHIRNSGVSLIALIAGVVYSSYMQVFLCQKSRGDT